LAFYLIQFLTGLASASSLFLAASGLSIIFGVTRVVNFAHGAFYMLGAYVAYSATEHLQGALGFWGGLVLAAACVAAVGALVEMGLLRRIYAAPELFQLLATFGVTLAIEDVSLLVWGPSDLVGRRAPGLRGAVDVLGHRIPTYDLFLIALGPLVLLLLWLLFHRTRWGILVRAAAQDRTMAAALGVNQKWLFTGVFALGIFLAALGGALHIPRDAATHTMDLDIIVEVFVIVVIGGLGSIEGAFIAAILVSELNAFGILVLPKVSLVIVFLVMIAVLIVRPYGLLGRAEGPQRSMGPASLTPWKPFTDAQRLGVLAGLIVLALVPLFASAYALTVGAEILIFVLFAASLHFLMGPAGLNSFGHAAYFGLGAYGAALASKIAGVPMPAAIAAGIALGLAGATLFGFFSVRLTGVYFAMLTLAFAQVTWSVAFQWVDVTGGDNGILGVWPAAWAASPAHFYWLVLAVVALAAAALRTLVFSPFGYGVRAVRDSTTRAEAIGIARIPYQGAAFIVAGGFAAVAGALFGFLKGSVFPDNLSISFSVDALVMVLLGGVETVSGAIVGAVVYKALSIWLLSVTDYSKLVLGCFIVLIVAVLPKGIAGTLSSIHFGRCRAAGRETREAGRHVRAGMRGAE
jgi:branched-chain amino acid transport system permease protein